MVVANLEEGSVAEADQRAMDEGQGETRQAAGGHWEGFGEGQGEDPATVVRQQSGSDDGGDRWPCEVNDGIAADGDGPAGNRNAAPKADLSIICCRRYIGNERAIPAFPAGFLSH